jgi:hypothetical protein
MKKLLLTVAISATALVASAQQQALYDTEKEMQEEMALLSARLGLSADQLIQIGHILNERRQRKDVLMMQIAALLNQLRDLDQSADRQVKALLEDNQKEKMDAKVVLELWDARAARNPIKPKALVGED